MTLCGNLREPDTSQRIAPGHAARNSWLRLRNPEFRDAADAPVAPGVPNARDRKGSGTIDDQEAPMRGHSSGLAGAQLDATLIAAMQEGAPRSTSRLSKPPLSRTAAC